MECQICFSENLDQRYKCFKCRKCICYKCLEMYIETTEDFLKCSCTEYIFPSSLGNVKNVNKYKKILLKKLENNFYEDISSIKDFAEKTKNIRDRRHNLLLTFPRCINYTINNCFAKELSVIKQKLQKNKVDYTSICHLTGCDGKIVNLNCNKCTTEYCEICLESKDYGHVCKEDIILSKNFIENMSIKCPKCNLPIEKSSGCSYLTCAACNTKFDHTTSEVSEHGGHSIPVNLEEKKLLSLMLDKFPSLSSKATEKIHYLENCNIKYNKKMLNLDDENTALKYYEKFLQEQKSYKEDVIKVIKNLLRASQIEEVYKLLKIA